MGDVEVFPLDVVALFASGVSRDQKAACVSKLVVIARFQAVEHAAQDFSLVLIDLPKIRVAAIALDAPQAGRQQFGGDPAFRVDAAGDFDGGLGANTYKVPLVIAPRLETGLVLLLICRILKARWC